MNFLKIGVRKQCFKTLQYIQNKMRYEIILRYMKKEQEKERERNVHHLVCITIRNLRVFIVDIVDTTRDVLWISWKKYTYPIRIVENIL